MLLDPLLASYSILGALLVLILVSVISVLIKSKKFEFFVSSLFLGAISLLSLYLLTSGSDITIFSTLRIYPFSALFMALFSFLLLLVNMLSYKYYPDYVSLSMLLSFVLAGLLVVPAATNILAIFLALELIAIATAFAIILAGKHHIEAAVKFFLLSSISIAVFSFALALLFPFSPGFTLSVVLGNANISGNYLILLAIILLVAALGFDTALFPFNLWIPDVYEGSPGSITAMLAAINKKVAFVALMEIFFVAFAAYTPFFSTIFLLLSVITMFYGNLVATVQRNVKRLFAYSSISQAGYILVGLAAATQYGLESSIFYIVTHSFMIIGAFAIVLWLESKNIKTIEDYNGLSKRNGFAAISLSVLMLSMAGIPPLLGFQGKVLLFSSAIDANLVILAIIGVINSFISIYYYAKVISAMYATKEHKKLTMDPYVAMVVIVALLVIIILGVYPQPLISIAETVSKTLISSSI